MKCWDCQNDFEEKELEESHDVSCYLFEGKTRKERKQQADKFGRKWLCVNCHDKYEAKILQILYWNLLNKKIDLILNRRERTHYFPKLHRLKQSKRDIGIRICKKLNEVKEIKR